MSTPHMLSCRHRWLATLETESWARWTFSLMEYGRSQALVFQQVGFCSFLHSLPQFCKLMTMCLLEDCFSSFLSFIKEKKPSSFLPEWRHQ